MGALNDHGIDYLLVGGVGGRLHGATRPTQDVDVLVRRTSPNLDRLSPALQELGARLRAEGLSDEEARALPSIVEREMIGRMEILTLQTDAGPLDVLTDMPGRDGRRYRYEDLRPDAIQAAVAPGLVAYLASAEAIIASKEWANRLKDHEALPELRALAQRRRPAPQAGRDADAGPVATPPVPGL